MPFNSLTALSPVDGRYRAQTEELAESMSEYALIKRRILVECEYFIALSETEGAGLRAFTDKEKAALRRIVQDFTTDEAAIVRKIEREGMGGRPATNHDVKAGEYFLKDKIAGTPLEKVAEWIHFALTSEDVNSVSQALMLRDALESVIVPRAREVQKELDTLANTYAETPMLARTHGQAATPTTFGKEMRVFESRIARQISLIISNPILIKFGGATGNYNAHVVSAPEVDWRDFSAKFIGRFNEGHEIGVVLNPVTTQIEPHDTFAELFDTLRRTNTICIDFAADMWRYVSDGWVVQKPKEGEIGSSAMPHKINPIDFENAEGNLGVANALFEHFSRKLPVSRLQRDLTDSTVIRTFGTAFAHTLIGYKSLLRGLGKISVQERTLLEVLQSHPEVLSEALQTVLRRENVAVPYEKLKELTRGKQVTLEDFARFVDTLEISEEVKERLKELRPENYIGLAGKIARNS